MSGIKTNSAMVRIIINGMDDKDKLELIKELQEHLSHKVVEKK